MTAPVPPAGELDLARIVATGGLTMGAVMITGFGLIVRDVGLMTMASEPGYTVMGLLPGAAALSFMASARAVTTIYDAAVPPAEGPLLVRTAKRFAGSGGAFGMFAVVVAALVGVTTALAVALLLPTLSATVVRAAALAGLAAFLISLAGMLTRTTARRRVLDGVLFAVVLGVTVTDALGRM